MNTPLINPRATIGDNQNVDQAAIVTDRMSDIYGESVRQLDKLLAESVSAAVNLSSSGKVSSDVEALSLGAIIKQLRDTDNKLESYREAEKQPFLRGGNAVDTFFHSLRDRIARRRKGDRSVKPGAIDVLQGLIDDWQTAKRAAELARLEEERLAAARLAREQAAAHAKALEEAEAARLAAERARLERTKAAKGKAAEEAAAAAVHAQNMADLAAEQAEEARLATMVKPADLVRVQGNDASGAGVTLTMRQEGYAVVLDRAQLDMDALRPYFTDFEIEKALRSWAKATGHKVSMHGAEVGFRSKGVTR